MPTRRSPVIRSFDELPHCPRWATMNPHQEPGHSWVRGGTLMPPRLVCQPAQPLLSKRRAPSTGLRDVSSKFWGAVATHQIDLKLHRQLSRVHTCPSILSARSVTNSV